jgi:hypothetical protein
MSGSARRSPCAWPQLLYAYGADSGDGRGMRGVTDVFGIAERRVIAALRTMPDGASGSIRLAYLDLNAFPYPCYRYGPVVARAWRSAGREAVFADRDAPGGHIGV